MLMTWLPMKPHPPAARSARRQQAHTKHTEAAAVSGRGRFSHQKCASVSRSNFPHTRARAHTHHTCKEDVFRLELTAQTHTHHAHIYTAHPHSKPTSAPVRVHHDLVRPTPARPRTRATRPPHAGRRCAAPLPPLPPHTQKHTLPSAHMHTHKRTHTHMRMEGRGHAKGASPPHTYTHRCFEVWFEIRAQG
jgi:hypothetical protein